MRSVQKIIFGFSLIYGCFLLLLVFLFLSHRVSPRQLGLIAGLGYAVGFVTLLVLLSRARARAKAEPQPVLTDAGRVEERKRTLRSIRSTKMMIGVMVFALVYFLITQRGLSILTTLFAVALNLCLTSAYVVAYRKQKEKLARLSEAQNGVASASFQRD